MKILYFGITSEITQQNSEELDNIKNLYELKKNLFERYPKLEEISFQISVNQQLIRENQDLSATDEIALLPPFAGG